MLQCPNAGTLSFFFSSSFSTTPHVSYSPADPLSELTFTTLAGGNSVQSEVLSIEILHRQFGARLVRTEMEIEYWPCGSKKTDYSCRIFDQTLGGQIERYSSLYDSALCGADHV
jgi:hypothetical protein